MTKEKTFRAEARADDTVLFLGPPGIGGYLYSLEEIAETFPLQAEDPEYNEIIRVLNFLLEQGRLSIEQPTVQQLANAFEIDAMGLDDENGTTVVFADPLTFPNSKRFGCQFSLEQLTKFGKGDLEKGVTRVKAYLTEYYRHHGSIEGAITSRPKKGRAGQVESSFSAILAWEKEQRALKKAAREHTKKA